MSDDPYELAHLIVTKLLDHDNRIRHLEVQRWEDRLERTHTQPEPGVGVTPSPDRETLIAALSTLLTETHRNGGPEILNHGHPQDPDTGTT